MIHISLSHFSSSHDLLSYLRRRQESRICPDYSEYCLQQHHIGSGSQSHRKHHAAAFPECAARDEEPCKLRNAARSALGKRSQEICVPKTVNNQQAEYRRPEDFT